MCAKYEYSHKQEEDATAHALSGTMCVMIDQMTLVARHAHLNPFFTDNCSERSTCICKRINRSKPMLQSTGSAIEYHKIEKNVHDAVADICIRVPEIDHVIEKCDVTRMKMNYSFV
jgi:hypothetical protein